MLSTQNESDKICFCESNNPQNYIFLESFSVPKRYLDQNCLTSRLKFGGFIFPDGARWAKYALKVREIDDVYQKWISEKILPRFRKNSRRYFLNLIHIIFIHITLLTLLSWKMSLWKKWISVPVSSKWTWQNLLLWIQESPELYFLESTFSYRLRCLPRDSLRRAYISELSQRPVLDLPYL